jgi:outer membrane protein
MNRLTLVLPALLLLATALVSNAHADGKPKFAYVDMQRALLEVDEGKKAKAALEKMKTERQKKLDAEQEALKQLQQNYEAQKAIMQADVRAQKEDEMRRRLAELQMTYAKLQKELAQEEAKLTKDIFERMARILSKLGEKEGYTMVFDKNAGGIVWAPKHLDITNELIRRYNDGEGK